MKTSLAPGSTVVTEYLEKSGPGRASRRAPVQPGRLRLHDLHRELRARSPRRSRRPSTTTTWWSARSSPGTATSRAGSTRTPRANYLASPPLVVAYALAGRHGRRPDHGAARPGLRRRAGLPLRRLAELRGDQAGRRGRGRARTCSPRATPTSSPATSAGAGSRCRRTTATPGRTRPTCASRPSSREWTRSRSRSSRSRALGCSPCSAIRSPPTTSRPRARSRTTARPGSG